MEVSTEVSFFLRLRAIDFMCYGFWTCWMAISYLVGIFANSLFFFFFFLQLYHWNVGVRGGYGNFLFLFNYFFRLGWRPVLDLKLFKRFSAFYPLFFFLSFSFGVYHIDRKCGC